MYWLMFASDSYPVISGMWGPNTFVVLKMKSFNIALALVSEIPLWGHNTHTHFETNFLCFRLKETLAAVVAQQIPEDLMQRGTSPPRDGRLPTCTSPPLTEKPPWPFLNPHLVSFPFYTPSPLRHFPSIYPSLRPVGTAVHRFLLKLLSTFGMEAQEVNPLRNPRCQCRMLTLK